MKKICLAFAISLVMLVPSFGQSVAPMFFWRGAAVASQDYSMLSAVPGNGIWFYNNAFGKGGCNNGADYTQYGSQYPRASFPNGLKITWNWPAGNCGEPTEYAYGYPEVVYGKQNGFTNPFGYQSWWPKQISAFNTFTAALNLSVGGNTDSYDVLLDTYAYNIPNPNSPTGMVAEISIFLHPNGSGPPSGTLHAFSTFTAKIATGTGGFGNLEVLIWPTNSAGTSYQDFLSGTVNLKEVLDYCASQGWINTSNYILGAELGSEPQTGNITTAPAPHSGSLTINNLSYTVN